MKDPVIRRVTIVVVALLPVVLGHVAAMAVEKNERARESQVVKRTYRYHFLTARAVNELQDVVCRPAGGCSGSASADGLLSFTAFPETHRQFEALLKEKDVPPRTFTFQVQLLKEDGRGESPQLPENVAKALKDLAAVFPGRSWTLLDSALARTNQAWQGFLGSGAGQGFSVEFRVHGDTDPSKPISIELFDVAQWKSQEEQARSTDTQPRRTFSTVLSTMFAMNVGETVVVGTSRTEDNKALVVLLTAVR